jgi:acylglycerol lipase
MLYSQNLHVKTFDQEKLYVRVIERGHPTWLVLTHGVGEHLGRYEWLSSYLAQWFNVCLYDLRGHGKSSGKRGYVDHFFDYSKDLNSILKYLKEKYKIEDYILYGHSMGGLITSDYIQNGMSIEGSYLKENYPKKVFLSSPAVAPVVRLGQLLRKTPAKVLEAIAKTPWSLPVSGFVNISDLSHDPRVFELYVNDPLVMMKLHLKLLLQVVYRGKSVFSKALKCRAPLYCIVGDKDQLVNSVEIKKYFQTYEPDCHLQIVEEGFHELHNEVDRYKSQFLSFLDKSLIQK